MHVWKRISAGLLAGLLLMTALGGCSGDTGGERGAAAQPQNAPSAARDGFRGVWVSTVFNLDYPSAATTDVDALRAEADRILENCVEMGMNAVILQVRPSCDALYPSSLFPWSRYLTGSPGQAPEDGFDPLAYWVERAHDLGLELHAWINPFRITKKGAEELTALPASAPAAQHPEWVVEHEGNYYLDPGIPEVRDLVIQGAEEIAASYEVDGIHLDDYFYPGRDFADGDTFAQYGQGFSDVGDWRRDNVNRLIRDLDQKLHAIRPDISFGVSPSGVWADRKSLPEGSDTTGGYESYYAAFADSRKWVKEGWVDYICPQIYWYIGHRTMDYAAIARWWKETVAGTGVKLYIGMADYMADAEQETDPWYGLAAIQAQLALNRELKVDGEVHFRYKFLAVNSNMKGLYERWYAEAPGGGANLDADALAFLAGLPQEEQNHWAAPWFGRLGSIGIVKGYPEGDFRPDEPVERSAMVKLVAEAMPRINGEELLLPEPGGGNPLPDTTDTWAETYIIALCNAGYLLPTEYPGGFHQAQAMTRAEVVKLLVRALGYTDDGSITTSVFPDVTMDFYYIQKAQELGIITGKQDKTFGPDEPVDRGSASAMLIRAMDAGRTR